MLLKAERKVVIEIKQVTLEKANIIDRKINRIDRDLQLLVKMKNECMTSSGTFYVCTPEGRYEVSKTEIEPIIEKEIVRNNRYINDLLNELDML